MPQRRQRLSPPQFLGFTIAGLILIGGLLLWLPISAAPGRHVSLLDAMFTATSAVCVTGLIVLDTPKDFSTFGQVVIMLLIQLGGLGYMTLSTVLITALGRSVTLQERMNLQEALNVQSFEGLVRFAKTVFKLVTLLREMGIKEIVAKAVTPLHGRILEKLGVARVVFPEREMAVRVAHSLVVANVLDKKAAKP
jgi:trk system potassium uptake protein TrkH